MAHAARCAPTPALLPGAALAALDLTSSVPQMLRMHAMPPSAKEGVASAAGPPQRLGERVVRATPVARAPVEALLASLSLGVQAGLDPDPNNAVAVATFTYAPPGQPPQQARSPHAMRDK